MTIDRTSWWWRRGRGLLILVASLLAAGVAADPLQNAAWPEVRSRQPEMNMRDLADNVGQGTLLGVLGGFRSILADFVWLQGYMYWEQHDRPNTEAMIQLATTLDPRILTFWDQGSSMIAYDIPGWAWRDHAEDLNSSDPARAAAAAEYINQVTLEQGRRGLSLLDRGLQFLPHNFTLLEAKARIYTTRLKDLPNAAENWRLAAAAADSPFFAARMYFQDLLKLANAASPDERLRFQRKAYDYLRQLYPTLPADAPAAQKGVMSDWLRALEDVLKIPHDIDPKYAPPPGWKTDPTQEYMPELFPEQN